VNTSHARPHGAILHRQPVSAGDAIARWVTEQRL